MYLNYLTKQANLSRGAMETGDHSKNGANPKSRKSRGNSLKFKEKNSSFGILGLAIIGLVFLGCVAGVSSCSAPSSVSSIEDAKKYLADKTFISTPTDGSAWIKVTFSGNSFKLWIAAPSAGDWGNSVKSGTYKLKENRTANTGELYFYAELVSPVREGENIHEALDRILDETAATNAVSPEQILIDGLLRTHNIWFIVNDLTFRIAPLMPGYEEEGRYKANEGDKNPWN